MSPTRKIKYVPPAEAIPTLRTSVDKTADKGSDQHATKASISRSDSIKSNSDKVVEKTKEKSVAAGNKSITISTESDISTKSAIQSDEKLSSDEKVEKTSTNQAIPSNAATSLRPANIECNHSFACEESSHPESPMDTTGQTGFLYILLCRLYSKIVVMQLRDRTHQGPHLCMFPLDQLVVVLHLPHQNIYKK